MDIFVSTLISALIQLVIFSLIPFIWWLVTDRKTNFFKWIGLKRGVCCGSILKIGIIIISGAIIYILVMVIVISNFINNSQNAASQFSGLGFSAIPSILIFAVLQTGLSEEMFFRGFLCKRLSNRFGFIAGNIIQSLCFGLLHGIPFGLATGNVFLCVLMTLLPAAIGYLQGWLNEKKAGGSILPSWILHSLMNVLSAISTI